MNCNICGKTGLWTSHNCEYFNTILSIPQPLPGVIELLKESSTYVEWRCGDRRIGLLKDVNMDHVRERWQDDPMTETLVRRGERYHRYWLRIASGDLNEDSRPDYSPIITPDDDDYYDDLKVDQDDLDKYNPS